MRIISSKICFGSDQICMLKSQVITKESLICLGSLSILSFFLRWFLRLASFHLRFFFFFRIFRLDDFLCWSSLFVLGFCCLRVRVGFLFLWRLWLGYFFFNWLCHFFRRLRRLSSSGYVLSFFWRSRDFFRWWWS